MCKFILEKYKILEKTDFKNVSFYLVENQEEEKNYIIKNISLKADNPHYKEIEEEFKKLAVSKTTISNNPLSPCLLDISTYEETFYLIFEYKDEKSMKTITDYTSVGRLLNNRYIILKGISSGGFGVVYLARDLHLPSKYLAIKEMKDTGKSEIMERSFKVESEILSTLKHPSIPEVRDFFLEDNRFYMVMDYIEGNTAGQKLSELKGEEFFPEKTVIDWALSICDILTYLHSQKEPVIFRDLKPDNIMITPEGGVKLIDFGIARIFHGIDKKTRYALLSQGYSPPEQYFGKSEPRSDIYSFGATFYHILTKKHPAELAPDFPPINKFNTQVSRALSDIIDRSLKLDIKDRYNSIDELKKDLLELNSPEDRKKKEKKHSLFHYPLIALAILFLILFLFKPYITPFLNPFKVWYWNSKGNEFLSNQKFEEAADCFDRVLFIEPHNNQAGDGKKNALLCKGDSLEKEGKYEEALSFYDRALLIDPENPEILDKKEKAKTGLIEELLIKGEKENQNNRFEEAIKCYEKILSLSPENKEALLGFNVSLIKEGNTLVSDDKYEEAMEIYDRVIEEDEEFVEAWYYKGELLYKENKYEEARECFKKVLEFDVFYDIPEEIIDKLELSALTHAIEKAPPKNNQ